MQGQVLVRHSRTVAVSRPIAVNRHYPWRSTHVIVAAPRAFYGYWPYYYGYYWPYFYGPGVVYTSYSDGQESTPYSFKDGVYYKREKSKEADSNGSGNNESEGPNETEISTLPDGATKITIEGKVYYRYNKLWYKEVFKGDRVVYKLVGEESLPQ